MGCCSCLDFLETGNRKTLFILSLILLAFGVMHFFFSEDAIIGFALGIIACFLGILGLFGAWRKDSKTLVIVGFLFLSPSSFYFFVNLMSLLALNLFLASVYAYDCFLVGARTRVGCVPNAIRRTQFHKSGLGCYISHLLRKCLYVFSLSSLSNHICFSSSSFVQFLCIFFAWRIHRQEGYTIQI